MKTKVNLSIFTLQLLIFFLFFTSVFNIKHPSGGISQLTSSFVQTEMKAAKKTRWTQDGRMCAHAFVQDGETYFDCTKSRSPDGLMNNKEWCYVENPEAGTKAWDYCKPTMDYDEVRKYNQNSQKQMTIQVNQLNKSIQQNIQPAQETLTELKKLQSGQESLFKRINEMFKSLEYLAKNMEKLYKTKAAFENQKEVIKNLDFQIEKMKEKQTEIDEKENEAEIQGEDMTTMLSAHEAILSIKKRRTNNCKGMMNYEDEEEGDGLIGKYYNNEVWIGYYLERKDSTIDFNWTGTGPMKDISFNNFSIKWEGFLYVPYTGDYNFIVEADDGIEVTVNEVLLLRKKLSNPMEEDESTKDVGTFSQMNANKITSDRILLHGGTKVKIIVKYFHSVHNDLTEDGQVYMKLLWQSTEFVETILPKKYLYSTNDFPPLKVTGFSLSDASLGKLFDNDFAFKNSDRYVIQDIPAEFNGATCLKFNSLFKNESGVISFHINTPSIIYIAFISHYPNPLPEQFENTGMVMSLLQLDKVSSNSKRIVAKNSATLEIYKASYKIGNVNIELNNKIGINKSGIPFILFFGFDTKATAPLTCLGESIHISNPSGTSFKACRASSEKAGMKCEDGFSGVMRDEEGGMWSSSNEGVGAWIEVEFKGLYEIRKFSYKNKKNPAERNKSIELSFKNGRNQLINLKNTDELLHFKIEPIRATSVKITIKEVFGTINNGGAFHFEGAECTENGEDANDKLKFIPSTPDFEPLKAMYELTKEVFTPLFDKNLKKPIPLTCRDSLSNTHHNIKSSPGTKAKLNCPESCVGTDAPVYGGAAGLYSKDSAICKAAYHAGKISSKGGMVIMQVKPSERDLKGIYRNGVRTEGKVFTEVSIAFEEFKEEDPIIIKVGTKVDVNISGSIFKEGVIREKTMIDSKTENLTIQIEGGGVETFNYPNSKIKPCGYHFPERDCTGSLKHYNSKLPLKIRFVPNPNEYMITGGYLPDYGNVYGASGKPFGFSRNMTDQIIYRGTASSPELETHIKFPPSPQSKYCNKPNPESNCEPVSWAAWVGPGKFKVKLFIGDPLDDVYADFSINGRSFVKSEKIPKNKLAFFEDISEAKGGFLIITSECAGDCVNSLSKLNAIEITPFFDSSKEGDEGRKKKEKKVSCGESFEGGRCDTGPDVLHCLFEDKAKSSAKFCSGEYSLVTIPDSHKCKEQIGKYKCVRIQYDSEDDCNSFCPKSCKSTRCLY